MRFILKYSISNDNYFPTFKWWLAPHKTMIQGPLRAGVILKLEHCPPRTPAAAPRGQVSQGRWTEIMLVNASKLLSNLTSEHERIRCSEDQPCLIGVMNNLWTPPHLPQTKEFYVEENRRFKILARKIAVKNIFNKEVNLTSGVGGPFAI